MKYNDYELIYMINEDEDAFSFLLEKYEPLFKKIAYSFVKRCASKGIDVDDLIQQCRITLCYVVDKYDYNRDVLFYTYLLVCLNRAIFNLSRRSAKQPECCYYMDFDNYENICEFESDVNISSLYDDYEFENAVIDFKNSLNDVEGQIFELRYNAFSYKDIASLLEINEKKVDNCLLKIRKKMEKYFLFS